MSPEENEIIGQLILCFVSLGSRSFCQSPCCQVVIPVDRRILMYCVPFFVLVADNPDDLGE